MDHDEKKYCPPVMPADTVIEIGAKLLRAKVAFAYKFTMPQGFELLQQMAELLQREDINGGCREVLAIDLAEMCATVTSMTRDQVEDEKEELDDSDTLPATGTLPALVPEAGMIIRDRGAVFSTYFEYLARIARLLDEPDHGSNPHQQIRTELIELTDIVNVYIQTFTQELRDNWETEDAYPHRAELRRQYEFLRRFR